MNEKERDLLFTQAGEIGLLKIQVAALQELVIALAIALTEKPNPSLSDTARSMETIRKLTGFSKGKDTADGMKYVIENLQALSHLNPMLALFGQALLHQDAGDAKRETLQYWLSQATPDEIGQDLWQALKSLVERFRSQSGGGETRDDDSL